MNKKLWKLQITGERLWMLSNTTAQLAASLEVEGRGLAVVAEETRKLASKIENLVERALFDDEEIIESGSICDLAAMLYLLALNNAIESHRLGWRGKPAAVCADDIRQLAYDVTVMFDADSNTNRYSRTVPITKDSITSFNETKDFLWMSIAGITVVEPLINIKEVCMSTECTETHLKLRGMEIPLIDSCKLLDKPKVDSTFVILQTPWAEHNKTYAVAANVFGIICCPIGRAVTSPANTPLAKYIREYWKSETDEAFYFMDWTKML